VTLPEPLLESHPNDWAPVALQQALLNDCDNIRIFSLCSLDTGGPRIVEHGPTGLWAEHDSVE
jgi:hypothetical protein